MFPYQEVLTRKQPGVSREEEIMAQSLLKAEHVKISFGSVHALRDVSLEILPGEIHCLAGEN